MDYILCFIAGTFFGTFISALMHQARDNMEYGCIECDKAVVYGDEEDDEEEYEDGE